MSKPYRIKVKDLIAATDMSNFYIDLPPLMPPQEFREIVEELLQGAGWARDEEGRLSMKIDEFMTYSFEPNSMLIVTHVEKKEMLDQTLEGWSPTELEMKEEALFSRQEQKLAEAAVRYLEETADARRMQCESWMIDATAVAIKQVATQLGDVEDIHEERGEDGSYQLTITIKEHS